jgi:hypothetical protein
MWHYIPEYSIFHNHCWKNLKSYTGFSCFFKSCQQYNKLVHGCFLPHPFQFITLIVLLFEAIQYKVLMPSLNIIQQLSKLLTLKSWKIYDSAFVEDGRTLNSVGCASFLDVTLCSLVDRYHCFEKNCHLHPHGSQRWQ